MKILVLGATGATGRLLTEQLLSSGHEVKVIVRSADKLPDIFKKNENLTVISASVLDLTDQDIIQHVKGYDAVASCLGHNLNWKGIYGQPRRLVTDATRRFCSAIISNKPEKPIKYVLMNTSGNRNRDNHEPISFAQKCVVGLIRLLLPPHSDNEKASDFLRINMGQNNGLIDWTAVRPDSLIDEKNVSQYEAYPSPVRSAIFDPGKTSRINVAHFMADLITNDLTWNKWKGQMPVIYNTETSK
jgi:NAD(P)H-binding